MGLEKKEFSVFVRLYNQKCSNSRFSADIINTKPAPYPPPTNQQTESTAYIFN